MVVAFYRSPDLLLEFGEQRLHTSRVPLAALSFRDKKGECAGELHDSGKLLWLAAHRGDGYLLRLGPGQRQRSGPREGSRPAGSDIGSVHSIGDYHHGRASDDHWLFPATPGELRWDETLAARHRQEDRARRHHAAGNRQALLPGRVDRSAAAAAGGAMADRRYGCAASAGRDKPDPRYIAKSVLTAA